MTDDVPNRVSYSKCLISTWCIAALCIGVVFCLSVLRMELHVLVVRYVRCTSVFMCVVSL